MTEDFSSHPMLEQWLRELERQGKSIHTISAYRRAVQHFQIGSDSDRVEFDPITITPRDIRNWKTYQRKQRKPDLRPSTSGWSGWRSSFQWAFNKRLVEEDPTAGVHSLQLPVASRRHSQANPQAAASKGCARLCRRRDTCWLGLQSVNCWS
jgi:site-specific recombinase XerD